MPDRSVKTDQLEICVQARLCRRNGFHGVGDLISYRSMLWLVNGIYLDASRNGGREVYYILRAKPTLPDPSGLQGLVR